MRRCDPGVFLSQAINLTSSHSCEEPDKVVVVKILSHTLEEKIHLIECERSNTRLLHVAAAQAATEAEPGGVKTDDQRKVRRNVGKWVVYGLLYDVQAPKLTVNTDVVP